MSHITKGRRLYPELAGNNQASNQGLQNPYPEERKTQESNASHNYSWAGPDKTFTADQSKPQAGTGFSDTSVNSQNTSMQSPFTQHSSQADGSMIYKNPAHPHRVYSKTTPFPQINTEAANNFLHYTNAYSKNPPPSYWDFINKDEVNAGTRYVRAACNKIVSEESVFKKTAIPFGFIVQPFADPTPEEELPMISNYGENGPLRCSRCRGYVNPNWMFTDGGRIGVCNLCKMNNSITEEYSCSLDPFGARLDRLDRPELNKGVYEFVAPSSYSVREPVKPNIIFCIETSTQSYANGIFHQALSSLYSLLDYMASPTLTSICILGYDTSVNLFKISDDNKLSIINIPDIEEAHCPFPVEDIFLNVSTDKEKIGSLIKLITEYYEKSYTNKKRITATCFGAALHVCCHSLFRKGGKVVLFCTSTAVDGMAKIAKRDDHKLYGTEGEKVLYKPQHLDYVNFAKFAQKKRIVIDIFSFAIEYFDIATISPVCSITGGNFYYYPTYDSIFDGEKLHFDLSRNLTRYFASDITMIVRTSEGIGFSDYLFSYGKQEGAEIEFAGLDADSTLNFLLKYEEKLKPDDSAYIQVALLYTNPFGERLIRVINYGVKVANNLWDFYISTDGEATSQLMIKMHGLDLGERLVKSIRFDLIEHVVDIIYHYRCLFHKKIKKIEILPNNMENLPLYVFSALKSPMLKTTGGSTIDDRFYGLMRFMSTPLHILSTWLYPKVFALHNVYSEEGVPLFGDISPTTNKVIFPPNIPASEEFLDRAGIYLIDNHETIYIYVRKEADPTLIQGLLGVEGFQDINANSVFPESLESDFFVRALNLIEGLRRLKNSSFQSIRISAEEGPLEPYVKSLLIEKCPGEDNFENFENNIRKLVNTKEAQGFLI